MPSKINIRNILKKHKETLKSPTSKLRDGQIVSTLKINKTDRFIFYILPTIISIVCLLLIQQPKGSIIDIYTLCLSIFIGLFLNLLVLIISFANPAYSIRDGKNRAKLVEDTFYNISYTVIASLITLGFLFLSIQDILSKEYVIDASCLTHHFQFIKAEISYSDIIQLVFSGFFYYMFSKVILTLLMIVKRIFNLFDTDIKEINSSSQKRNL